MKSQTAIETKDLSFSFDDNPVLKQVNITIETGKFYGILGPNGSGKTTLLRTIAKSLDVNENVVFLNGKDLKQINMKSLAKELAVVPQNTEVRFDFTVFDLVLMGRAPYISRFAMEGTEDLRIAQKAMELTDTWRLRERNIQTLSGGERQRVIVARAIAQRTGIIILDEPVSHLDIYHQIKLLKQISALNQNKRVTVLAALHDLNLAAAFCDLIILMNRGMVHSLGIPAQILKKEIIREIYGVEVDIVEAPEDGRPYLIPRLGR